MRIVVATAFFCCASAWAHEVHSHHGGVQEYAWGKAGAIEAASRTVHVEMADALRYSPDRLEVRRGETVRFIVHNAGKLPHELVIGTERELREHAQAMRKHPDMQHDDPYMVQVAPGGTREMAWTFSKPGRFSFGCLVPGHWEGGMKGTIQVSK